MPTAMRRWCGSGDCAGFGDLQQCHGQRIVPAARARRSMSSRKALDEHEGSAPAAPPRRSRLSSSSSAASVASARCAAASTSPRSASSAASSPSRLVERLAPLHLLHQEVGRHRRVVLGVDRRAVQLAQVGGALERILQPLIGLVDAHRPLHRDALRRRALGGEAVGMGLALQLLPARVERGAVQREAAQAGRTVRSRSSLRFMAIKSRQHVTWWRLGARSRRSSDAEALAAAAAVASRSGC